MARRRRRRALGGHPELRMAYGARARSLGRGILDLLPPPPESAAPCSACSGAGCLLCRRWAHLIRDDDPIAYRHLVTRAVCVLDPAAAAPPPPRYTLGNSGLSQAKLVGLTMKMMLEQGKTTNVLCNGRGAEVGQAQDLVSSSSWDILLHRIGDLPMCYILRHSSIFLPVKRRTYLQVAGLPIISLLKKRTIQQSQSTDEFQGPMETAKKKCPTCYLWRDAAMAHNNLSRGITSKSADNTEEVPLNPPATSSDAPSIEPKKPRKRKRLYSWQRCSKQTQACRENTSTDDQVNTCFPQIQEPCNVPAVLLSSHNSPSSACVLDNIMPSPTPESGRPTESADNTQNNTEEALLNPPATSSDAIEPNCEFTHKPRKRKRTYSWQRRSKQKQLCRENTSTDAQVNTCFPQIQEPSNVPAVLLPSPTPQRGPICFNCLMLNASKRVSVDSLIRRFGTFYNTRISRNVFRNSLSNKRKGTDAALSLIKRVFGIKDCCIKFFHCKCGGSSTTNSNCMYHWLLQQVKNLIRNSKRCQYQKLFMRHCSAKSKVAEDGSLAKLEAYSTHQQVVSFVCAVLARIIPKPLLGNPSSKRCLRMNIWKFVSLRRFETFQVTDCIGELKVAYYSWLSKFGSTGCSCSVPVRKVTEVLSGMEEQEQKNLLHCWISWLFSGIVIPLINTYFYVTERQTNRYDVFYYPKSVWRNLTSNAIASLDKRSFRTLCGASRRAIRHLYRPSTVRFVPKEKDVRPLVKFKTQRKDGLLSKCHLVIKKVRDENPEMFGSSVFDYDGIHKKLSSFMSSVRGQLKEELKIYIVVADVSKAFDCVNQDMLLKIMDDVLKGDEYVLRNCTKVVYSSSKNAVYRFDSNVSVSNGHDFSIQPSSSGGILVDQGTVCTIRKEELHRVLFEQVKCNILKLGQNFYLQQVGIAQGNKLSTHLCSLYYGNLENSVIMKFLHDAKISSGDAVSVQEHLLMRFTDDFMFVSFSKEHALNFLNRMRRGFVYYNSYMNERKYGFNFKVGSSENCHNRLYMGDDGVYFIPWSGLLINCETLEIQADYIRYSGITIKSTLTVKMHSSIKEFGSKLCHYMRPKCHPIFYDSNINSPGTVRLNLYQAFLLCAMKFHCYIGSLGYPSSIISKPEELLHMIKGTFRYMHGLIARRMAGVPLVLKLRRKETIWLGLSAYICVLGKKQSRHKDLLALLMEEVDRYGPMDRASADSLRYAVDDSHSSMFWKLKY